MSATNNAICSGYPLPEPFIFNTVAAQKAANTVYANISTTGVMQFKDDFSRMQYLLGKKARDPLACNAASNCRQ